MRRNHIKNVNIIPDVIKFLVSEFNFLGRSLRQNLPVVRSYFKARDITVLRVCIVLLQDLTADTATL